MADSKPKKAEELQKKRSNNRCPDYDKDCYEVKYPTNCFLGFMRWHNLGTAKGYCPLCHHSNQKVKMTPQPNKYEQMFIDIALLTAKESNCVKYKVGCVVVKNDRVVLQGYNGTIKGFINCNVKFKDSDMGLPANRLIHNKWSDAFEIHAEMNVITYAAKKGISLENSKIYVTHKPCNNCMKHLIISSSLSSQYSVL